MDTLEHRRVRMRLPVRLRWTTPFAQKIELGESIDVSRGGLLVSTKEPHAAGVPLWVTCPYDASLGDGQPEMLARIIRCGEVLEVIRATNARDKAQPVSASAAGFSATMLHVHVLSPGRTSPFNTGVGLPVPQYTRLRSGS